MPVRLDHPREFLEGLQALPAQPRFPLVEETPCPPWTPVVPKLIEGFLEQVSLVQAPVGLEQHPQRFLPFEAEVLPVGEQGVPLSLDESTILPGQPRVFALADLVHGL